MIPNKKKGGEREKPPLSSPYLLLVSPERQLFTLTLSLNFITTIHSVLRIKKFKLKFYFCEEAESHRIKEILPAVQLHSRI